MHICVSCSSVGASDGVWAQGCFIISHIHILTFTWPPTISNPKPEFRKFRQITSGVICSNFRVIRFTCSFLKIKIFEEIHSRGSIPTMKAPLLNQPYLTHHFAAYVLHFNCLELLSLSDDCTLVCPWEETVFILLMIRLLSGFAWVPFHRGLLSFVMRSFAFVTGFRVNGRRFCRPGFSHLFWFPSTTVTTRSATRVMDDYYGQEFYVVFNLHR